MQRSDKYSIAWFKLAECVTRGEKERALGVYRLLSHSLDDDAFADQLAGDLLLSFADVSSAIEKYKGAAKQYLKQERYLKAAAVYEHLVTLEPEVEAHRLHLIELYRQLKSAPKVNHHVKALFEQLIEHKKLDKAAYIAEQLELSVEPTTVATMHEQLLFAFLQHNHAHELAFARVQKIINAWARVVDHEKVERFLQMIKTINDELYHRASDYYAQLQ